ncbi:MAG: signal recognition particle-docking protein FtsY [Thermodesulfobacteriota bacterium]|nr:signal recognition particle-docking protein FtsY [Thermodesulfobacteriota bacterium]
MVKWFKRDKKEDRSGRDSLKKTENETPEREDPLETFSDVEDSEELEFTFEVEAEPEPPAPAPAPEPPAPEPVSTKVVEPEAVMEPEPELAGEDPAKAGPPEPPLVAEKPKDKKGLLARLKERLANTRAVLNTRVDHLLLGVKEIDEDVLEDLEEILITADMGVKTTQALIGIISDKVARKELDSPERLKEVLRDEILRILSLPPAEFDPDVRPHVIMVVGVNGVGKTTTIAKLAHRYITDGRKVMIAAGDTFRAAAVEQLQIWAERVGADLVKQQTGADPSAVVFDALHAAQARGVDIVIIDTAGRLHTKVNLMEELKKINRIAGREMPGAPHEVLMVLDATTGQNAVNQARLFSETVPVSHLAMTKLDGTAKGGILVAMCYELGMPIRYIGIGEGMDDLRDFDPKAFAEALFV